MFSFIKVSLLKRIKFSFIHHISTIQIPDLFDILMITVKLKLLGQWEKPPSLKIDFFVSGFF